MVPVAVAIRLGLPEWHHSRAIHTREAAAAAIRVATKARPALPFAANALPALNPDQPTQSSEAPITVKMGLWGGVSLSGKRSRLPSIKAITIAETPAVV